MPNQPVLKHSFRYPYARYERTSMKGEKHVTIHCNPRADLKEDGQCPVQCFS